MPNKKAQDDKNEIKLNADATIEREYLLFALKNLYPISAAYTAIASLVLENFIETVGKYYKNSSEYNDIHYYSFVWGIFAVHIHLMELMSRYEASNRKKKLGALSESILKEAISKQDFQTSEHNMQKFTISEESYWKLRTALYRNFNSNMIQQIRFKKITLFFAIWGLLNFILDFINPIYAPLAIFSFLPAFINRSYYFLLMTEAFIESGEVIRQYRQNSLFSAADDVNLHLKQLQSWSFCTTKWELNSNLFHRFSLELPSNVEITLHDKNQNGSLTFSLSREFYANKLMHYLADSHFNVLFFNENYILVKNWKKENLKNQQQHLESFTTYLKAWGDIIKNQGMKLFQLVNFLKSQFIENITEVKKVYLFDANGLPEIKFIIEIPEKISDKIAKKITDLQVKLIALYDEKNVVITNNAITVNGYECANETQIKSIQNASVPSSKDIIAQNENNNARERSGKKQKPEVLTKKLQIIAKNLLSMKNLPPDVIAAELTIRAANDEVYYPLLRPGRRDGTTYAKVNQKMLENTLEAQDKKNFSNNAKQLDTCIKKLSYGHVSSTISSVNTFFYHNNKPKFNEQNNNNNVATASEGARSYLKIEHEKINLYATKIEKFKIKDLARENTDSKIIREIDNALNRDDEIICYDFNYLELN